MRPTALITAASLLLTAAPLPAADSPASPGVDIVITVPAPSGTGDELHTAGEIELATVVDTDPHTTVTGQLDLGNRYGITATTSTDLGQVTDELTTTFGPDITVEPDLPVELHWRPNDPGHTLNWAASSLHLEQAWATTRGSARTRIAIVDTGVNPNPDLGDRLIAGVDLLGTGDGRSDRSGHGTRTALTAGATANNAYAGAGVCPRCTIIPIRALSGRADEGRLSDLAAGIVAGADARADVINISAGGPTTATAATDPAFLRDAIAYARQRGAVITASAGNFSDTRRTIPAAADGVISVSSHDRDGARIRTATYGSHTDVSAPGCYRTDSLTVTWPAGTTIDYCGTSAAAPQVAGIAALYRTLHPTADPDAVTRAITSAADGRGFTIHGRVNASGTLQVPVRNTGPFDDVAPHTTHTHAIEMLAQAGVTTGCAPRAYCPRDPVTRAQMATFLTRTLTLPASTPTFADVAPGTVHAPAVGAVQHAAITDGCTPRTYCPRDPVTRAQMATFLTRALELPPAPTWPYRDVPAGSVHDAAIAAVTAVGISQGCGPQSFCPTEPVTREQMASFLHRARSHVRDEAERREPVPSAARATSSSTPAITSEQPHDPQRARPTTIPPSGDGRSQPRRPADSGWGSAFG